MKRNNKNLNNSMIVFYGYNTDKDGKHEEIATMTDLSEKTARKYFKRLNRELNSKKFLRIYPMFTAMKSDEIYAIAVMKKEF